MKFFPLDRVRLLPGPFSDAVRVDLDYVMGLDPDRLLAPFLREAGLPAVAESYGNWEDSGLDGHTAGHYLSALALLWASNAGLLRVNFSSGSLDLSPGTLITTGLLMLLGAGLLGIVFLVLKGIEYADAAAKGLGTEAHPLYTFYWLLTGFHAAHVAAGVIVLALVAIRLKPDQVEAGAQFWHMVDLVWVILFPIIYLLR